MADYSDLTLGGAAAAACPYTACGGKWYFVDPVNGKAGADGTTPRRASNSIEAMYAKLRDNRNDGIFLIGGASANALAAAMTWSKNYCHLWGISGSLRVGQRCRVTGSAALDLSPLITVSGNGNTFTNVQFYNGKDSNSATGGVYLTGSRNVFENVMIAGVTHATPGARTTDVYDLHIYGGSENEFKRCYIGIDTFIRHAASSVVRLGNQATRNVFTDTMFTMWADAATPLFVYAGAASTVDRYTLFDRCKFVNTGPYSAGSVINEAFDIHASCGGFFYLSDCKLVGVTDWEAATVSGLTILDNPTGAVDGGLAIAQTA